jgi:glycosyltransferase involved in cell wall biosynthesis
MISVIVPAYNAAQTIEPCIQALQHQLCLTDYEIIVVDDGSTDKTAELAEAAGATVLRLPHSRAAAARNAGIRAATGDILCFTDADCTPTLDWLVQMITPFSDTAVMGCKGVYKTRQRGWVARFVQAEYEDKYDLLRTQETIDFIDTYSAAYRREVLLANGGFDERFSYVEDQELSFRLAAQGHKMVFQPTAIVFHRHSHTLWGYFRKKVMIGYWKAQVVRKFPQHLVKDSHTPQVMKVQIGLVGLMGLGTAVLPFMPPLQIPLLLLFLFFLLTTLPFIQKTWPKDHTIALLSPFLLAVRALALGVGYVRGAVWKQ